MAGVLTPDDEVASEHRPPVDVLHRLHERPRPPSPVVVAAIRIGRPREEVTERGEAGAVGRQRQLACERERTDGAVVNQGLVSDPPPGRSDDPPAYRH